MATSKVRIQNGYFVNSENPMSVSINGWECKIKLDGTIECNCVRIYSDGEHCMRYVIRQNGFAKLTLKTPYGGVKTLRRGYVLPRGEILSDGLLGLAGGNVDTRYAYFRNGSFQSFLDKYGITAVKHEDPNQVYSVRNALYGGGSCKSKLYTDGSVFEESYDLGRSDDWIRKSPNTCASECTEQLRVSGATWVIHDQDQHEGDCHNCFKLLYTLADPTTLVELPERC